MEPPQDDIETSRHTVIWLALAALLTVPVSAAAQVPGSFQQQGRLLNDDGSPATGTVELRFTIYDSKTGGSALWEGVDTVEVDEHGFYTATIGSEDNPIDPEALRGDERWLAIAVDGEKVLSPRTKLHSVPYAKLASRSQSVADGGVNSDALADDFTLPDDAVDSLAWGQIEGIPPGIADGDQDTLGNLGCDAGEVAKYDGSAWVCSDKSDTIGGLSCDSGQVPRYDGTNWTCADETSYAAGTGLSLDSDSNTFSADQSQVASWARDAVDSQDKYVEKSGGSATNLTTNGELSANDGVKLGSTSTCDGSTEGTVRYENGFAEYCDGSKWVTLASKTKTDALDVAREKMRGIKDTTELYYFAFRIPGAGEVNTPANDMILCTPTTDDVEPGTWSTPHSNKHRPAYILGHASDENGHCLEGASNWNSSGDYPCMGMLVSNWVPTSHEGFGAWCRRYSGSNGSIVWAQINVANQEYWNSRGVNSNESISKPSEVGDIECTSSGYACVERLE